MRPLATLALAALALTGATVLDARPRAGELEDALGRARTALATGDASTARTAFELALSLDPDNAEAHRGLGHHEHEGRWYATYVELAAARREEARRMLRDHGLVRHAGEWVPGADVPFLRMQWVRDEAGRWQHPQDLARQQEARELAARGFQQQDTVWVAPEEFDRWREGLWKVGERWLDEAAADQHHSSLATPWVVPGEHFLVHATVDHEAARWAAWWADRTQADLERLFGARPAAPPRLWVLRDIAQYNTFCGGDANQGLTPAEGTGWSSLHYACFGDALFDNAATPPTWRGAGICWWDRADPTLDPYGQHAVRHAAAQAWIDALDPSWDAVSLAVVGQAGPWTGASFWAEKRVPLWLRQGAASYCERYFLDDAVGEGGDPAWARAWGLANLAALGGVGDLQELFAMPLDTTRVEASVALVHRAGALVAFLLDGGCPDVRRAHEDWLRVWRSADRATADEAARDLERALLAHPSELQAFLGR